MQGQISMYDYMSDMTYDRNGKASPAPDWVDRERCENCTYWSKLLTCDQPPSGWGVKGTCGSHRGQNMYKTGAFSFCQEFTDKHIMRGR